jgi:hypothetical protein
VRSSNHSGEHPVIAEVGEVSGAERSFPNLHAQIVEHYVFAWREVTLAAFDADPKQWVSGDQGATYICRYAGGAKRMATGGIGQGGGLRSAPDHVQHVESRHRLVAQPVALAHAAE